MELGYFDGGLADTLDEEIKKNILKRIPTKKLGKIEALDPEDDKLTFRLTPGSIFYGVISVLPNGEIIADNGNLLEFKDKLYSNCMRYPIWLGI